MKRPLEIIILIAFLILSIVLSINNESFKLSFDKNINNENKEYLLDLNKTSSQAFIEQSFELINISSKILDNVIIILNIDGEEKTFYVGRLNPNDEYEFTFIFEQVNFIRDLSNCNYSASGDII